MAIMLHSLFNMVRVAMIYCKPFNPRVGTTCTIIDGAAPKYTSTDGLSVILLSRSILVNVVKISDSKVSGPHAILYSNTQLNTQLHKIRNVLWMGHDISWLSGSVTMEQEYLLFQDNHVLRCNYVEWETYGMLGDFIRLLSRGDMVNKVQYSF